MGENVFWDLKRKEAKAAHQGEVLNAFPGTRKQTCNVPVVHAQDTDIFSQKMLISSPLSRATLWVDTISTYVCLVLDFI